MSASVNRGRGFSLPEVLVSMVLLMAVITTVGALQGSLSRSSAQLAEYRLLWRIAWNSAGPWPEALPAGWKMRRVETLHQRCVSISVTITAPSGRAGQLSRLHCPPR